MRAKDAPWLHLLAVTVLGVITQLVVAVAWLRSNGASLSEAASTVLPGLLGATYGMLPIAAGTSAALVVFRSPSRGRLVRLAMVASLAMLLADVGAAPRLVPAEKWLAVTVEGEVAGQGFFDFARESVVRDALSMIAGDFGDVTDRGNSRTFAADSPRLRASFAIQKGGLLLLPMLLVAIAAGLMRWLQTGVVFTSVRHFRIVAIGVAWAVSLGGTGLVVSLGETARAAAMTGNAALTMILLPYVPLWVAAVVLWKHVPRQRGDDHRHVRDIEEYAH